MHCLIDSHAHLEEVPNLENALARAQDAGVLAVVSVGSDYESNNRVLEIAAKHSGFVFPALGLHPNSLAQLKIFFRQVLIFYKIHLLLFAGLQHVPMFGCLLLHCRYYLF